MEILIFISVNIYFRIIRHFLILTRTISNYKLKQKIWQTTRIKQKHFLKKYGVPT